MLFIMVLFAAAPFAAMVWFSLFGESGNIPEVHFDTYAYIFAWDTGIWRSCGVTFLYALGTALPGAVLMSMFGYALSRKKMICRNFFYIFLFLAAVLGSGGISLYILAAKYLHIENTLWVYILPHLVSPWYVLMTALFFRSVPGDIIDAAVADGAGEGQMFFCVALPMAKPVVATLLILIFISRWNDWKSAVMYIDDAKLKNIQYYIYELNMKNEIVTKTGRDITGGVRFASAVMGVVPAAAALPFFGKYLAGGIICGGLK